MSVYRICYAQCDQNFEPAPHIHTDEGIFVVTEELDEMERSAKGPVTILNDVPTACRMDGKTYICQQSCQSCLSMYVGNQNFAHCPNCGKILIHEVERERTMNDARLSSREQRLVEALQTLVDLLRFTNAPGHHIPINNLRLAYGLAESVLKEVKP